MAFFIARADYAAADWSSPPGKVGVEIILTDKEGSLALLWSLELAQNGGLAGASELLLFNETPPSGNRAQPIAEISPEGVYSGLVLVKLSREAFSQLPTTPAPTQPRLTLRAYLKILLDQTSAGNPDPSTLSAIAGAVAARLPDLRESSSLSDFMLTTSREQRADSEIGDLAADQSKPASLGSSIDVRKVMRSRTSLFAELQQLVVERRMVFLVGGMYSYLQDFLQGFRRHLVSAHIDHVEVDFEPSAFTTIRRRFAGDSIFPVLDSFLASVAFRALQALRLHAGAPKVGIFKEKMIGKPIDFAKTYLRAAESHSTHWDCIKHFMDVLDQAVREVRPATTVTIFLPFNDIDQTLNWKLADRQQVWEGMSTLRHQLDQNRESCPGLGVVFAANTVPVRKEMHPSLVQYALLRLPPFSRDELSDLLGSVLGLDPPRECLDTLDCQTGGVPFFVSLVLRTALALLREPDSRREPTALIEDSSNLVRALLSPEPPGSTVATRVPREVRAEISDYRGQLVNILGRSRSTMNTSPILTAWQYPRSQQGQTFGVNRGIDEQLESWLDSGLVWTQASDEERGNSLHSLREYPEFRLCRAGELPLELGNLIIEAVNNPVVRS